jgi:hypothetical protein
MQAACRETRVNIGKARRYQRRKLGAPLSLGQLREIEILKSVNHVFGETLPDDDYGREVLFEVLNQLALSGVTPDELREHGLDLLPEVGDDDTLYDMVVKIGPGRKRKADDIARRLGVDYQLRTLLDLRTIGACDVTRAERKAIAAQKEAADKRWQREKTGAKPRAESAARKRPWEAKGIGRTKYYALRKAEREAAAATPNDAQELVRRSYSSIFSSPKQFAPETDPPVDPRPTVDPRPRSERDAPAGPRTPSHCQASSFDQQQEPPAVVSEVPAVHAAEPVPTSAATNAAEPMSRSTSTRIREAHFERNALLKLEPLDAEQGRRLAELDRIIETARHELEQRPRRDATDFACTDLNRVRFAKIKNFAKAPCPLLIA